MYMPGMTGLLWNWGFIMWGCSKLLWGFDTRDQNLCVHVFDEWLFKASWFI